MIILAGIDEAGLGPTIGPLVTASAALRVPGHWRPETPWEMLAEAVSRTCGRRETRPTVADSKESYRRGGILALERAVGVFALLAGKDDNGVPRVSVDDRSGVHPCYSLALAPFPLHCGGDELVPLATAVEHCLSRHSAAVVHLEAVLLPEPALNSRFAAGLNKNQALLVETGKHLVALERAFAASPIFAVVDKQGGRNDYLPYLFGLFPGGWIETLTAGAALSAYRLRRKGGDMEIHFAAKADRGSFPTALASMLAKYARERAMAELNAWFARRRPAVAPTAGYPEDAKRWLAAMRKTATDGLHLDRIVRKR